MLGDDWPAVDTPSFRDYMDEQREIAERKSKNVCAYPVDVKARVPRKLEWWTVADVAARLGVTDTRVKALCRNGQIPGAKHKGRAWRIPARYDGGEYRLTVLPGKRGPASSYETQILLRLDDDIPF
jgi:excisionase family DNA binding protein